METTRLCTRCQQPLSADAPDGLCPQCLLRAATDPPPSAAGDGLVGDIIDIGDPAEVAKKLPQFEILEMLGRGGMGVVYRARQRNLDRIVALKILPPIDALSPDFVARFSREARALAKLNHPNIVNVYDFGETGGLYYIIMEYVDGTNLRQVFQARRLTPAEALAIVPKICDALEYAHEEGLVHRDIKPENLLLDKKGRVKIADFGLAKLLRREALDVTLTLSGMALGTLRYMAPEQMDKPETVDHRADLYSLGVVIYEMLTGETPVGRFELPSQKAQVDVRLDRIVLHALEKEPARRYQHASEVRTDVENVTNTPQAAPVPAEPPQANSDRPSFIQEAGEVFVAHLKPRDMQDFALTNVGGLIVLSLFWVLPAAVIYFLCNAAGVGIVKSLLLGASGGGGVILVLGSLLVSGSVQSVSLDSGGLTLHRVMGPSRFLPWASIVQIQTMTRWDALKTMVWPGLPPHGTMHSFTTKGFYRIACVDECWHFVPGKPEEFLDAVRRLRNLATAAPAPATPMKPADPVTARVPAHEASFTTNPSPAADAMLVALRPLPRFFHLRCFVALLLGWSAAAALCGRDLTGLVSGAAILAAIVLQMGRSHANRSPLWLAKLRQQGAGKRIPTIFMNLLMLVMVFMMFLGGLFMFWDSSAMRAGGSVPTSAEFEAHYKGKEYQLLRQLKAFQEHIPTVELTHDFADDFAPKLATPTAWIYVLGALLILGFFFQQSAGDQTRVVMGLRRGGWAGAASGIAIFLASLFCAYLAILDLRLSQWVGRPHTTVNQTAVVTQASPTQAVSALYRWAAENGYASGSRLWNLVTVPKGEEVAKAGVFDTWKASHWERWRMTVLGPERPFPYITAEIYGSEEPTQTIVVLTSGPGLDGMVETGSPKETQWRAIMKSLSAAVSKAGDFKPLHGTLPPDVVMMESSANGGRTIENYIEKPKVQQAESSPDWLGLGGVLAAMLLWAFVSMRYLTPALASGISAGAANLTAAPGTGPLSPAEEAIRRARASWLGERSERFRTLLPPALVFLELVFLLAGLIGWPSPWLEWTRTYTPHKHGVDHATNAFAFHPFTLSFGLFVTGWVCAFLVGHFSRIDHLVRYGRRFRELRKDIQRQAKFKMFGCVAVAMLLSLGLAVLFVVLAEGGLNRTAATDYTEFRLLPKSKAYEELLIDMPFYSIRENGVNHYRQPKQWDMAIGLKTKASAEPVTMDIEMPSLKASYRPSWSENYEVPIVLDLDELTKWMSDRGKVDVTDEKVKKEAAELMTLLKQFSRQAPVEYTEYLDAQTERMSDFWMLGSQGWPGRKGTYSSMNGEWLMVIYLAGSVICLALYFVVALRIQREAFALDQKVREQGEGVLVRRPLPRVKFRALAAPIRASLVWRAVFWGGFLLFVIPALAARWQSARPEPVKQTWYYGFAPRATLDNGVATPSPLIKHFQEVILSFTGFESYQRDGETWFVQPNPLLLEITFCRPKNYSDKPGEFHEVIPAGQGIPEGETFSFTVELPGLHANLDYLSQKSSVTLDEEELLRWMESTIATTTTRPTGAVSTTFYRKPDGTPVALYSLPMSETPELKSLAADLMAFLKKYATSAPTTREAFLAVATKIPSLNGHSSTSTFHGEWHKGVAIIPAIAAAILIFLALLPLLKRSAVRAAVRQGLLPIPPETPVPANAMGAGGENLATGSAHAPSANPPEPRLSRLALWGAIWAPLSFIAALAGLSLRIASLDANGMPLGPNVWHQLLMLTLLPAGVLAPFATTILGFIAVAQIKRSGGRLYGLRLAAADALLFPLLVLFLIVVMIVNPIAAHILSAVAS